MARHEGKMGYHESCRGEASNRPQGCGYHRHPAHGLHNGEKARRGIDRFACSASGFVFATRHAASPSRPVDIPTPGLARGTNPYRLGTRTCPCHL